MKGDNDPEPSDGFNDKDNSTDNDDEGENTLDTSDKINNIWKEHAAKDMGYVPLKRLTAGDIYSLKHGPVNWDDIDPYSGLEEEIYTEDAELDPDPSNKIKSELNTDIIGTIYFMRERKPKPDRHSTRPLRNSR